MHHHSTALLFRQTENLTDILDPAEMGKKYVKSLPLHYTTMDLDVPVLNTNSHRHPASRLLINVTEEVVRESQKPSYKREP